MHRAGDLARAWRDGFTRKASAGVEIHPGLSIKIYPSGIGDKPHSIRGVLSQSILTLSFSPKFSGLSRLKSRKIRDYSWPYVYSYDWYEYTYSTITYSYFLTSLRSFQFPVLSYLLNV